MPTTPPSIDPVPTPAIQRGDRATFSNRVDAFINWLVLAPAQFVALAANVIANAAEAFNSSTAAASSASNAASSAAAATSAVGAAAWVSGATYQATTGTAISLINLLTYRRIITGAGTTDPANDPTNWAPVNSQSARIVPKTSNATITVGDRNAIISCTAATDITLTYPTAAAAGNGWNNWVENLGTAMVVAAGITLYPKTLTWIVSNGAAFKAFPVTPVTYGKVGTAIASAATLNLDAATGDAVHITGSVAITAITLSPGVVRTCIFDGTPTISNSVLLILPFGSNITVPVGVYSMTFLGDAGGVVRCISAPNAVAPFLYVRDEKASGTASGTSNTTFQTRTLNTVVSNTISGASLSSDTVTLPAGTYRVSAKVPCSSAGGNRALLYNVTDAATALLGTSAYADTDTTAGRFASVSFVEGAFTIAATKTFRIDHYTTTNGDGSNGLGRPAARGGVEVYTDVKFWKDA